MVKFDPSLLRIEYAALTHITTALKGSMRLVTLDDEGEEIETRYPIPFAVARAWKEKHKVTKYLAPIPVAVVYYGEMVVMVEKGPQLPNYMLQDPEQYGSLFGDKPFTAYVEEGVAILKAMCEQGEWETDGFSVYRMPDHMNIAFETGVELTADGKFRAIEVGLIKFAELSDKSCVQNPSNHTLVAIKGGNDKIYTTPPIFKNIAEMRQDNLGIKKPKKDEAPSRDHMYRFDMIDKNFDVNLEFALAAGNTVGRNYGYKAVGPLRLERLMLALTTVNLPNIKQSIRATFPTGMTFLQAYAWLTGLASQTTDLTQLMEMRALIKTLCTKGIFKKNIIERVFRKDENGNVSFEKPTMLSPEQLKEYVKGQSESEKRETLDRVLRDVELPSTKTVATGMNLND